MNFSLYLWDIDEGVASWTKLRWNLRCFGELIMQTDCFGLVRNLMNTIK